jgi:hypothetical protein
VEEKREPATAAQLEMEPAVGRVVKAAALAPEGADRAAVEGVLDPAQAVALEAVDPVAEVRVERAVR